MDDLEQKEEILSELPQEAVEVINKLPQSEKETITRTISMFWSGAMRPINPVVDKLQSEHLTLAIQNAESESIREYKAKRFSQILFFVSIILVLFFVSFLIHTFKEQPKVIADILIPIITLVGGFISGRGYEAKKNNQ